VVFLSDHGFHLGEKKHWRKWTLWNESTRVPLIVRAPGRKAGVVADAAVSTAGIGRTLAELCDLPGPAFGEERSLAPLLDGRERAEGETVVVALHRHVAVCDERWRYIRYATGAEELYDWRSDPNEFTNLAPAPASRAVKERLGAAIPATLADLKLGEDVDDL
jgi:arylsulfatase A-like enzyme